MALEIWAFHLVDRRLTLRLTSFRDERWVDMTHTLVRSAVAMGFSGGILLSGLAATASAAEPTGAPVADSGSATLVQTGFGTGSAGLDLGTAMLLCKLTGGDYRMTIGMLTGPSGCLGGLLGYQRN